MNSLILIFNLIKQYKIYFLYRFILDRYRIGLQYIKIPNQNVLKLIILRSYAKIAPGCKFCSGCKLICSTLKVGANLHPGCKLAPGCKFLKHRSHGIKYTRVQICTPRVQIVHMNPALFYVFDSFSYCSVNSIVEMTFSHFITCNE